MTIWVLLAAAWLVSRDVWLIWRAYCDPRVVQANELADRLIAKKGATMRYQGFDPDLRARTAVKRAGANQIRRIATRVESGTDVLEVVQDVKVIKEEQKLLERKSTRQSYRVQ